MKRLQVKKTTAAAVVFSLVFSAVAPSIAQANLWQERKEAVKELEKNQETLLARLPSIESQISPAITSLSNFAESKPSLSKILRQKVTNFSGHKRLPQWITSLPLNVASLRKVSFPFAWKSGDPIVIHIQDAHLNQDAQTNIGKSIQHFIDYGKLDTVALEGAFGPIDISRFRKFSDQDAVHKVADYLLKENKISGAIHTAFSSEKEIPAFVGVDDQEHYNANVDAYKNSAPKTTQLKERLKAMIKEVEQEKSKLFNSDLAVFDKGVQSYREGKEELGSYIRFLSKYQKQVTPQAKIFLKALDMESSLDFSKVEKERATFLDRLVQNLTTSQANDLMNASLSYRLGNMKNTDFYLYLQNLSEEIRLDFKDFPLMGLYIRYALLSDEINADKLFEEVKVLEEKTYLALAKSKEEKELSAQSKALYLADKLVSCTLTREEWKEYDEIGSRVCGVGGSKRLDLSSFESFYRESLMRDQLMPENLLKNISSHTPYPTHEPQVAVLVTGGFHSDGIESLLNKSNVAVITYAPKIAKVDTAKGSEYLSAFTQEKTPLQKLFDGDKLFLAQKVFVDSTRLQAAALLTGKFELKDPRVDNPNESDNALFHELAYPAGEGVVVEARDIGEGAAEITSEGEGGTVTFDVVEDKENGSIHTTPEATALSSAQSIRVAPDHILEWNEYQIDFRGATEYKGKDLPVTDITIRKGDEITRTIRVEGIVEAAQISEDGRWVEILSLDGAHRFSWKILLENPDVVRPMGYEVKGKKQKEDIFQTLPNSLFYWIARVAEMSHEKARTIGIAGLIVEVPALIVLGMKLEPLSMGLFLGVFAGAHIVLESIVAHREGRARPVLDMIQQVVVFSLYLPLTAHHNSPELFTFNAIVAVLLHLWQDRGLARSTLGDSEINLMADLHSEIPAETGGAENMSYEDMLAAMGRMMEDPETRGKLRTGFELLPNYDPESGFFYKPLTPSQIKFMKYFETHGDISRALEETRLDELYEAGIDPNRDPLQSHDTLDLHRRSFVDIAFGFLKQVFSSIKRILSNISPFIMPALAVSAVPFTMGAAPAIAQNSYTIATGSEYAGVVYNFSNSGADVGAGSSIFSVILSVLPILPEVFVPVIGLKTWILKLREILRKQSDTLTAGRKFYSHLGWKNVPRWIVATTFAPFYEFRHSSKITFVGKHPYNHIWEQILRGVGQLFIHVAGPALLIYLVASHFGMSFPILSLSHMLLFTLALPVSVFLVKPFAHALFDLISPAKLMVEESKGGTISEEVKSLINVFFGRKRNTRIDLKSLERLKERFGRADQRVKEDFLKKVLETVASLYAPVSASDNTLTKMPRIIAVNGPASIYMSVPFLHGPEDSGKGLSIGRIHMNTGGVAGVTLEVLRELGEQIPVVSYGFASGSVFKEIYANLIQTLGGESLFVSGDDIFFLDISARSNDSSADVLKMRLDLDPPLVAITEEQNERLLQELLARPVEPENPPFVAIAGKVYHGLPPERITRFIEELRKKGYRVLVNFRPFITTEEMEAVLKGRPAIVKPNFNEFCKMIGITEEDQKRVLRSDLSNVGWRVGSVALRYGIERFIVSMDKDGAIAALIDGDRLRTIRVSLPKAKVERVHWGGDILLGSLLFKLSQGETFENALAFGVALSTTWLANFGRGTVLHEGIEAFLGRKGKGIHVLSEMDHVYVWRGPTEGEQRFWGYKVIGEEHALKTLDQLRELQGWRLMANPTILWDRSKPPEEQDNYCFQKTLEYATQYDIPNPRSDILQSRLPQDHFFGKVLMNSSGGYDANTEEDILRLLFSFGISPVDLELDLHGVTENWQRKRILLGYLEPLIENSDGMPSVVRTHFRKIVASYIYGVGPRLIPTEIWRYNSRGFLRQMWKRTIDGTIPPAQILAQSSDPEIAKLGTNKLAKKRAELPPAISFNRNSDDYMPDETSARNGQELFMKLRDSVFEGVGTRELSRRDRFVLEEILLRSSVQQGMALEEFASNLVNEDLTILTGEAIIRLLYRSGVIKRVEGSKVLPNSLAYWIARVFFKKSHDEARGIGIAGLFAEIPVLIGLGAMFNFPVMGIFLGAFTAVHIVLETIVDLRESSAPFTISLFSKLFVNRFLQSFIKQLVVFSPYILLTLSDTPFYLVVTALAASIRHVRYDIKELSRKDIKAESEAKETPEKKAAKEFVSLMVAEQRGERDQKSHLTKTIKSMVLAAGMIINVQAVNGLSSPANAVAASVQPYLLDSAKFEQAIAEEIEIQLPQVSKEEARRRATHVLLTGYGTKPLNVVFKEGKKSERPFMNGERPFVGAVIDPSIENPVKHAIRILEKLKKNKIVNQQLTVVFIAKALSKDDKNQIVRKGKDLGMALVDFVEDEKLSTDFNLSTLNQQVTDWVEDQGKFSSYGFMIPKTLIRHFSDIRELPLDSILRKAAITFISQSLAATPLLRIEDLESVQIDKIAELFARQA